MALVTTSVQIDSEDYDFIKAQGLRMRSVIRAGILHLKGSEERARATEETNRLRMEIVRLSKHKDMVFYIFEKHPEIYNEARKVTQ